MKNNSEELITYKITVTDEGQEAPVVITHQEDYARTSQCYITEYIETINDTIEHYETSDTPPEYDEVEDALITYEKHITEINGVKHEITVR